MSEISGFAYSFFFVALSLAILIIIAIILYYIKIGDIIRDLFTKKEDFETEIQNVYYSSNTYKRKVQRAKEMLTFAYLVNDNSNLDSKTIQILSSSNPLLVSQPNNIFRFMERVFGEIMDAEDELTENIKLANHKLKNYNIFIQTPYLPKMMAGKQGMMTERYDDSRLTEIEKNLNDGLTNISLLEEEIRKKLVGKTTAMPEGQYQNNEPNQIEIDGNNTSLDNDLEFLGSRRKL
jgi:hypothetical protein